MRILLAALALAILPAKAVAQVGVPTPVPTLTPQPDPGPPSAAPPPVVEPPPPGTQTITRGFDLAHTFYSAEPAAKPPFGIVWKADLGGSISSPLVADGRVFVSVSRLSGYGAAVVALDAASGRELWRYDNADQPYFSMGLAYGDGIVVAVDPNGRLHGLDAATGARRWLQEGARSSGSHPLVANGLVYLQGNGQVDVYDLATGSPRFEIGMGDGTDGLPAIAGDRLYVLAACTAHAFDRRDGNRIWRLDDRGCSGGGGDIASLYKRRVIGDEFFLDAETGARIPDRRPVRVVAGDVGVAPEGDAIVGRDMETGAQLWAFKKPDDLYFDGGSALAAAGDTVFWRVGQRLMTLDRRTGAPGWVGRVTSSPAQHGIGGIEPDFAIGDGVVLVPVGGRLWALSGSAGDVPPQVTAKRTDAKGAIIYGSPVRIEGQLTSEGLAFSHPVSLMHDEWPFRGYRPARRRQVEVEQTYAFSLEPRRNTVYRVEVPQAHSKPIAVVVLPRFRTRRLDNSPGDFGRLRVDVRVPRSVRLAGRTLGMYVGRGAMKRYTRLGVGRVSGRRGRYRATFTFRTVSRMGRRDFIALCVRGIHRQGMSFGDRLDRSCGAARVRF